MEITSKQRRNAERELTSIVCAGCDGEKQRIYAFCHKCSGLLVEQGARTGNLALLTARLKHTAKWYTDRLEFLLSRKGQQLRRSLESVSAG